MVAEIVGGWLTGSMALLADGWHMGTHVAALAMAGIAYALARRWSRDERFAFGTWKIEVLGAFSSALVLAVVALAMAVESAIRLVEPRPIDYGVALAVAVVGLAVNVVSAFVLSGHGQGAGGGHARDHGHDHGHGDHDHHVDHHGHHDHHDLNLRAAYVHVLTDAFTSVLAIVALAAGMLAGWAWLDPVMGLVGAGVIAWWARGLIVQSALRAARPRDGFARRFPGARGHRERRRRRDRGPARLARRPRPPRLHRLHRGAGAAHARRLPRAPRRHRDTRPRVDRGQPLSARAVSLTGPRHPMPPTSGKIVREFRHILLWPLQLRRLRRETGFASHWDVLRAHPGPWQEVKDNLLVDDESCQTGYQEFVYFLPYVQRFLYGFGEADAQTPSSLHMFRRDDIATARVRLRKEDAPIALSVERTRLVFFYDQDVAILAFEVMARDLPLEDAIELHGPLRPALPAVLGRPGAGRPLPLLGGVPGRGRDAAVDLGLRRPRQVRRAGAGHQADAAVAALGVPAAPHGPGVPRRRACCSTTRSRTSASRS